MSFIKYAAQGFLNSNTDLHVFEFVLLNSIIVESVHIHDDLILRSLGM